MLTTAVPARRMALVWLVAAAFSLSLAGLLASPVRAATITVTTTTDEYNTGADCSLREAIVSANTDAAFGGCTAGIGADIITLPAGTYTLSIAGAGEDAAATGDLDITSTVTINGAGAGATIIDGAAGLDRVLHFVIRDASSLAITGVTIRNGTVANDYGGGLAVNGLTTTPVTLTGVAVTGNTSSTFGAGGILNTGVMTITNSTISGNTATTEGAGIFNGGVMTITNSTISGNTAGTGGGGMFSQFGSSLAMTNSTISGNTAGTEGGGLAGMVSDTIFTFLNVTITNNSAATGGGVWIAPYFASPGTASFKNSIVANQLLGANCAGPEGGVTSAGNNLSSDASCPFSDSSDQNSTPPQLGPLAANGGPTLTHALLAGSLAIDRANNTGCPATDQRNVGRPRDGDSNGTLVCDIGAYELEPSVISINDVSVTEGNSDTVDAVFTVTLLPASPSTITVAYATANGTATVLADYQAAAGTVTFVPGDTSETITVRVVGDTIDEPDETFVVNLSAPVGATIADAQGIGTILDDDAAPTPTPAPTPVVAALPDAATAEADGSAASSGWLLALGLLLGIAALSLRRSRARAPIRGR